MLETRRTGFAAVYAIAVAEETVVVRVGLSVKRVGQIAFVTSEQDTSSAVCRSR